MTDALAELEYEIFAARTVGVWDDFWTGVDYAVQVMREEHVQVR